MVNVLRVEGLGCCVWGPMQDLRQASNWSNGIQTFPNLRTSLSTLSQRLHASEYPFIRTFEMAAELLSYFRYSSRSLRKDLLDYASSRSTVNI